MQITAPIIYLKPQREGEWEKKKQKGTEYENKDMNLKMTQD